MYLPGSIWLKSGWTHRAGPVVDIEEERARQRYMDWWIEFGIPRTGFSSIEMGEEL